MILLFKKLKIRNLTMSFALILILFLAFGIVTTTELFTLGNLTRIIYEHPLVVSNAALNAALNITKMHRSMKDVVLSDSPSEMKTTLKLVDEGEAIVYQQLDIIRETILGKEGKNLEQETRQIFIDWKPIRAEVVTLLQSGHKQNAVYITREKGADHAAKLEAKMLELTSYARNKAGRFLVMAEKRQSKLENITIVLTLSGIVLSALIAFFAIKSALNAEKVLRDERDKLKSALAEIKTLHGIIPICSHCKQIRDDKGLWKQLEEYIHTHSDANFSHGICPDCMKKHHPEAYASVYSVK
jgi:hypothetical protein